MALAAAQVIDALAARLATVVATGGRVFTSRGYPITEAELPAWRVVASDEAIEPMGDAPEIEKHTLSAEATAYARVTSDLDDTLHALAATGLTALYVSVISPSFLLQTTAIARQIAKEGEAAVGSITVTLQATFYALQSAPESFA